jgi:maltose O-acetyltransferase
MRDFGHRVADAFLGSAYLTVGTRMRVMRALGYGVQADTSIWSGCSFRSKRFSTGRGVFINSGFFFDGGAMLSIGDNVRIGQFVRVITASHDIGPPEQRGRVETTYRPVTIKQGCWIGSCAIILPGVVMEPGCVLAAGAVLAESTEPNGLYAGNPARLVRMLPT